MTWLGVLVGIAAALLLVWVVLVIGLLLVRPSEPLLREALRILPDMLRLLRRLTADRSLPRGVRVRLSLLMVYLAIPIDLVPDIVPVLGYAEDAIIVVLVLRSVVRRAGLQAMRRHWPGTADGFAAVCKLAGVSDPPTA